MRGKIDLFSLDIIAQILEKQKHPVSNRLMDEVRFWKDVEDRVDRISLDRYGCGDTLVTLVSTAKYILHRDRNGAYIQIVAEGPHVDPRKYRVRLERYQKSKDAPVRYRANIRDIPDEVITHLAPTRIWESVNFSVRKPRIYLYRLVYALANPTHDIFWNRTLNEEDQMEIMHLNGVSVCDFDWNLRLADHKSHTAYDDERIEREALSREEELLDALAHEDHSRASFITESFMCQLPQDELREYYWVQEYMVG